MADMVAMEKHLWLKLTGINDRDKMFLLDAPVSPSDLFGDSVRTVITRILEAKRHAEAFDQFLPCRAQASGLSIIKVSKHSILHNNFNGNLLLRSDLFLH